MPSAEDTFHIALDRFRDDFSDRMWRFYLNRAELCESEIERILLASLIFSSASPFGDSMVTSSICGFNPDGRLFLAPQYRIDKYRVDFAIYAHNQNEVCSFGVDYSEIKIAIECDGHQYHSRTKDQAKRDRGKDRCLQTLGWKILRFTGSEIFNDPFMCADQVRTIIETCVAERERRVILASEDRWHD